MKPAGEQVGTSIQRPLMKPGLDGLARLLGQLEPHWPTGFLLHDHSPLLHAITRDDIVEPQGYQVAAAQLAIEGEIEQREVTPVSLSYTATLVTEIGGLTPCTVHDRIDVANQLTITGATLEVILINGFVPAFRDRFDIMDWGSITGAFGAINTSAAPLPHPLAWDFSELYLTGEFIVDVLPIADGDLAPWNNPDGQINSADVLIASQLATGQRTAGALQYARGDMNSDDVIDAADVYLITRIALGL